MRREKKTGILKVRRYAAILITLNDYLYFSPGANLADNIYVTYFNMIILIIMHNIWYKQAYVQDFDCK